MNSSDKYNVVAENELTSVIAHFNTEFIMTVVSRAIESKFYPNSYATIPNLVDSLNMNFDQIVQYYQSQDASERIATLRYETFREIINRICGVYNLNFTVEDVDVYTAARFLYDFFISNFTYYMCNFFAQYIIREIDSLYEAMNLGDLRKNKDTSTIYNKKIFENEKLAIAMAHIDKVVRYIEGMDFSFQYIVSNCGLNLETVNYLLSIVSPAGDFYKDHYVYLMRNDAVRPNDLNYIRFAIRNIAVPNSEVFSTLAVDSTDQIDPVI